MNYLESEIFKYILITSLLCIILYTTYKDIISKDLKKDIYNYKISKKILYIKKILFIFYIFFLILSIIWNELNIFFMKKSKDSSSNITFLIDISKSMNVEDISNNSNISRLNFAKKIITNHILENPENQYSFSVFAWKTIQISPLTNNTDWLISNLDSINTDYIKQWWTNIEIAIKESLWTLSHTKNKNIIILSDWEELDNEINFDNISKYLSWSVKIFSVWLWSKSWWYIPIWTDYFWNTVYKYYNNEKIISRLNEESLKNLAKKWGWIYLKWDRENILNNFNKYLLINKKSSEAQENQENINIYALLSFFSLLLFYIINDKKLKWKKQ